MKTKLIYSFIYNRELNLHKTTAQAKRDFVKLKDKCNEFEILFEKHIVDIIKLIPKYTEYKWKTDYIPVYIVEFEGVSFHDPLTLRHREDAKLMLVILIHELVHVNTGWHGYNKEREIDEIAEKIFKELDIN